MSTDFRITLTKRMLKEGLLKCMASKTISKISVSELCKEAGVNRTTFYNHYESPTMVLKEIVEDYALKLREIYFSHRTEENRKEGVAVEACLEYLYSKKEEIKILYSKNSENRISGYGLEIVINSISENKGSLPNPIQGDADDAFLCAVITSSAAYGLIQMWLTTDMKKTPKEIMSLLIRSFGGSFFA